MHIDIYSFLVLILAGFASGLFIGICSGTAAGFMIPILTVFLGKTNSGSISIYNSIGTSLFVDSIVGISAGLIFLKKGKTKLKIVIPVIITAAIGAFIGSFFTSYAPERGLNLYLGVVLVLFGINLMYNGYQKNVDFIKSKYSFSFLKKHKLGLLVVGGLVIGLLSGLTGFGGAGFVAIGLIFIFDFDLHTAIGTSLIVMFFLAGFGSIGHIILDEFIWDAAMISGSAAVVGAFTGSIFSNKINEDILGKIIGLIMLLLGCAIFLRILF